MNPDRSEEIQVLYEVISTVGEGLELQSMLSNSLSIILRKLNCSAGAIHFTKESRPGSFGFQLKKSIPRNFNRHPGLKIADSYLPDPCNAESLHAWWRRLPLTGRINDNHYFQILSLHPHGVLTMVRAGNAFSQDFLRSLRPVAKKMTAAISTSISNAQLQATLEELQLGRTELKKYQNHLELMVEERTDKWARANRALKKEIKERKLIEKALVEEKSKLQDALIEIKKLSGMLPICSNCKKIRDDTGYWNQLEAYLIKHSEAKFSHGICPECAKVLYPELGLKDD